MKIITIIILKNRKINFLSLRLLASLLIVGLYSVAYASPTDWKELFNSKHRPTVAEFLEKVDLDSKNPFKPIVNNDDRVTNLLQDGAELICQLEFAYPNAVWAPLGRDSSLVADLLEAFYLKIGQPNRVVRLNASGTSFVTGTQEMLLGFLRTAGLLDRNGIPIRNFVILDPTSWNTRSQSRRLISAVYNTPHADPTDYKKRINVIALGQSGGSYHSSNLISPTFNLDKFLQGVKIDPNGPSIIPSVTKAPAYLTTDTSGNEIVWHGKFGAFKNVNGLVVTEPGTPFPNMIEHVLWQMYMITKYAQSDAFIQSVKTLSLSRYKRNFPIFVDQFQAPFNIILNQQLAFSPIDETSIDFFLKQPLSDTLTETERTLVWLIALSSMRIYSSPELTLIEKFVAYLKGLPQPDIALSHLFSLSKNYPEKYAFLETNLSTFLTQHSSLSQNPTDLARTLAPYFKSTVQSFVRLKYKSTETISDIPQLLELHSQLGDTELDPSSFRALLLDSKLNLSTSQFISLYSGSFFSPSPSSFIDSSLGRLTQKLSHFFFENPDATSSQLTNEFVKLTSDSLFTTEMLARSSNQAELNQMLQILNNQIQAQTSEQTVILNYLSTHHPNFVTTVQNRISELFQQLPSNDSGLRDELNLKLPVFKPIIISTIREIYSHKLLTESELTNLIKIQSYFVDPIFNPTYFAEHLIRLFPNMETVKIVDRITPHWTTSDESLPGFTLATNLTNQLKNHPILLASFLAGVSDEKAFFQYIQSLKSSNRQFKGELAKSRKANKLYNNLIKQAAFVSLKFADTSIPFDFLDFLSDPDDKLVFSSLILETRSDASRVLLPKLMSELNQEQRDRVITDYLETFVTFFPTASDFNDLIRWVEPNSLVHQRIAFTAIQTFTSKAQFKELNKPRYPSTRDYLQAVEEFKTRHRSHHKNAFVSFFKTLVRSKQTSAPVSSPARARLSRANLTQIELWQLKVAAAEAIEENRLYLDEGFTNVIKDHLKDILRNKNVISVQVYSQNLLPRDFYINLVARSKGVQRQRVLSSQNNSNFQLLDKQDKVARLERAIEQAGKTYPHLSLISRIERALPSGEYLPLLTHFDLLKLLQGVPRDDQMTVYIGLSSVIYTRLEFYPPSILAPLLNQIDLKTIEKIKADSTNSSMNMGQQNFSLLGNDRRIPPERLVSSMLANLKGNQKYTAEQLVQMLKHIPLENVSVQSERDLIPLRNRLRVFLKNKEWTGSDLYCMGVTLNLVLIDDIFARIQELGQPIGNAIETERKIWQIWNQTKLQNIESNPKKPHLKSPKERQISKEGIKAYLDHLSSLLK